MYPIFLKIGPLTIHTYGVLIAIGFLTAMILAARRAKVEGLDPQKMMDLCFYILVAAIVGSRLLYIIVEYKEYIHDPLRVFKIWEGGLVFYGGFLLGIGVVIYYLKVHKLPLWKTSDILAPSIAIGQAIGRWGCFAAGCCHGKPTNAAWAVTFTDPNAIGILNTPVHPTQLYESFFNFTVFLYLIYRRPAKKFDGELIWTYILLYAIGRFIIEFFRGDDRGFLPGEILSTSQFVGIFLFIAASTMLLILGKKNKKT